MATTDVHTMNQTEVVGTKRSRSGRLIRRPSEVYVPEVEKFEDDFNDNEYDDDDDGSDIDTEDEGSDSEDDDLDDDDDAGSLDDFIVDSDDMETSDDDDYSDSESEC